MTTFAGLLVLVLVAGTQAGPSHWLREGAQSLCSMGCRANDPSKLRYELNKPYVYNYAGTSRIQLKDVNEGETESRWSAQVVLTWLSPCDMAITMKGFNVEGATSKC
ncbi:vitellogenin-like [Panulirus ornatus]|uniref:vitellogenin-like n=1 Tax=Panulirus ornatus TaxID=150431 RepID=UPI003A843CBE